MIVNRKYMHWLRTNGVNTKGAAAKVMKFDRFGNRRRTIDRC